MQFNYKQGDTSVNVSKVSPLKRAIQLLAGLVLVVITTYVILGLFINIIAPHVPKSLEDKMGKAILSEWTLDEDDLVVARYSSILEKLIGTEAASQYAIRIIEMEEVNAFAVPGNLIVFSSAFVDNFDDEETIAFVLGHELGHFENRDHIKGYGRAMVLYTIAGLISGDESASSTLFLDVLTKTEMKFSQSDELRADAYGAKLIYDTYNSYNGATALFGYFSETTEQGQLMAYFDSHPHPEKRVKAIQALLE